MSDLSGFGGLGSGGDGPQESCITVRHGLTVSNSAILEVAGHEFFGFNFEKVVLGQATPLGLASFIDAGQQNDHWTAQVLLPWDPWGWHPNRTMPSRYTPGSPGATTYWLQHLRLSQRQSLFAKKSVVRATDRAFLACSAVTWLYGGVEYSQQCQSSIVFKVGTFVGGTADDERRYKSLADTLAARVVKSLTVEGLTAVSHPAQ